MKNVANKMMDRTPLSVSVSPNSLGNVNDLSVGPTSYVVLTGGPVANWNLTGIVAGDSIQILEVENETGYTMTLTNQDVNSSAANRLVAAKAIASPGVTRLIYSQNKQRWIALT